MNTNINLYAILGPTNTGKTYLAFERLISYKSGIFGFPLRLLARENYDKAVLKIGSQNVALITGEEKIIPKQAKYFFCTVESMPLNIEVECIAIDEVQLAADYERGHIFTDRLLNLRGIYETIFLGSTIIENILLRLFPKIKIEKRDRFSKLTYLSKQSINKLEPRTAIIAFNINSVYEIAESLRSHKGGAAVVLGSLSPRTRNAQVEVYEDKKVDFLVATDAIGMGLNLNINHVSFSSLQKFDGRYTRDLSSSELGQIAGRAGRYLNDGSFSCLKSAGSMDPLIIKSIEDHNFNNIQRIYWRNSNIDFSSVKTVLNSFKQFPTKSYFIHKKNAEDEINFRKLSEDTNISPYLNKSESIILLWDVCRIPDFQKIFNDSYLGFLKNIFLMLVRNDHILKESWLKENIIKLENYSGGIDELSVKIANIRTWTYISNQSQWLTKYKEWQEKTREIENILSDHLHTSLTNRFVDFSASYFVNVQKRGEKAVIDVDEQKSIKLNGQNYGYINGFDLELNIPKSESLFSLTQVKKSIRSMIEDKINNFLKAPLESLSLGKIEVVEINSDIKIYWGDEPIGKLKKGKNIYSPVAEAFSTEFLESDKKIQITKKLQIWIDKKIEDTLKPIPIPLDDEISSDVRAIIFNVYNCLGTMLIKDHYKIIKNLNEKDKVNISKSGIRIGAKYFFMPNLLKKFPMQLNAILWKVFYSSSEDNLFPLPTDGRVSFNSNIQMPESYWSSIGYICLDKFAVRIDVFERIFYLARKKIKYGPFAESSEMMNPIGCNSDQLNNILQFCGFKSLILGDNKKIFYLKDVNQENIKNKKINKIKLKQIINLKKNKNQIFLINKSKSKSKSKSESITINKSTSKTKNIKSDKEIKLDPNSPFAVLQKLL